jgi:cold shock CspA family protein
MSTTEINPAGHAYSPTIRGRVQWFSPLKGFGFIKSDRGKPDIFVHHTAIATWNKQDDAEERPVLRYWERVEFQIVEGKDGKPAARNVKVLSI